MIPVWPFVWIAVWLWQRHRARNTPGTAQNLQPYSGRSLALIFIHTPLWAVLMLAVMIVVTAAVEVTLEARRLGGGGTAPLLGFASGIVVPPLILRGAPRWLAWRVLRPLGLRRAAHVVIWLAPFLGPHGLPGLRRLLDVSLRHPPGPGAGEDRAGGWPLWSRAVQAALQGDLTRVLRLMPALERSAIPMPRLARVYGGELLARAAAARGDWRLVGRAARAGRGRLARLWRLLARAHAGQPVAPWRLRAAWLLAPERRALRAFVDAAPIHRAARPRVLPVPARAPAWSWHVALLDHVSAGGRLDESNARELLGQWSARTDAAAEAAFRARALELGAADGAARWAELVGQLDDELLALLDAAPLAVGDIAGQGALGARLAARLRDRLHADLDELVAAAHPDSVALDGPVDEWERWLLICEAVERLERRAGLQAVRSAWHNGLRDVAWNRPCRVFNTFGSNAAQACYAMFSWTAALAHRLGDAEAARVNAENARIARKAA